jgi:hypothetical protein
MKKQEIYSTCIQVQSLNDKPMKTFHCFKYIVIFVSFLGFFCGRETAPGIDEAKFIDVYAQYLIFQELKMPDSTKIRYQEKLLSENDMTPEELRKSVEYFRGDPERWVSILGEIRDRITELKKEAPYDSSGHRDLN